MKVLKYRMDGRAWDVSKHEKVLRPFLRDEGEAIKALCSDIQRSFLGVPDWMQAYNGATLKTVCVGRAGWEHRGWDYYSITSGGVEYHTRSFVSALRIFGIMAKR